MKTSVVLVQPGLTIGQAVRAAGQTSRFFSAKAPKVVMSNTRPQGRSRTEGCPTCAIDSRSLLRAAIGGASCAKCRKEAAN